MRLRYDGPGHVLKAFGKTIERGADDTFTEQEARSLLAQPQIRVTVVESDAPPRTGAGSGKDAWAAYAAERGIDTDGLTREQIIAAVDAADAGTAGETPDPGVEPEALDEGAGHHDPNEQEE